MTIFEAASDESAGRDPHASVFVYGGFVAPEHYWRDWFAPAWHERVLAGPPAIPYLHMTDIRSRTWRRKYGVTWAQAERRVDEAIRVIDSMGCLHPVTSEADAVHFARAFATIDIGADGLHRDGMKPDHLCFLMFAFHVLGFLSREYPDAKRVNFVIERTDRSKAVAFRRFHDEMALALDGLGLPSHARLVGALSDEGRKSVPLQAADVLCWHARRAQERSLDSTDARRYNRLARLTGFRHRWTADEVTSFADAAVRAHPSPVTQEG